MGSILQPNQRCWLGIADRSDDGIAVRGALGDVPNAMSRIRLLLRDHGVSLGWIDIAPGSLDEKLLRREFESLNTVGLDVLALPQADDITVVVCTRNRPTLLSGCIQRLHDAHLDGCRIIVVDNAPQDDRTATAVEAARARGVDVDRVIEEKPGLSRARNTGLRQATTTYVAFTDDDARVDVFWLRALRNGFRGAPNVSVVTGLVPPAVIETDAQLAFQKKVRWSDSLCLETFSMEKRDQYDWAFPYSAGHFGTGANFAVDRLRCLEVGGFDECLGAGTRTEGGEDMEMFTRILRLGDSLTFEPRAIVWHFHRATKLELRRLMYGYGKGLSATCLANMRQGDALEVVRQSLRGLLSLVLHRRSEVKEGVELSYLATEFVGLLVGPLAYAYEVALHRDITVV